MSNEMPRQPTGQDPEAVFARGLWDKIWTRLRFINTPTVKWSVTTRGISADVRVSSGGSSGGSITSSFRGLYIPAQVYSAGDMVVIQSGVSAGTYVCTIDNNSASPDTGQGWMQIAPGNTVGQWS